MELQNWGLAMPNQGYPRVAPSSRLQEAASRWGAQLRVSGVGGQKLSLQVRLARDLRGTRQREVPCWGQLRWLSERPAHPTEQAWVRMALTHFPFRKKK